ncbi:MAG: 2-oxoglutarate dehydrogenase complex dihydrolipoyllysine-residue succinyltransferase [Gemmatimonadaceae bacterium]|nr:2-oxoglutarate dehydrogenase complex dihydrolipoyllysine-residue succinyltransferase [Gemmatimonadaceae bacterium]
MISIKVPPLGESIVEATVSRWLKQEGDAVAAGETLVELETDKITVEVPALKAGVLTARTRAEGDVVAVDDVLGQLDESGTATAGAASALLASDPVGGTPDGPPVGPTPVPTAMATSSSDPVGGTPDGPPVGPTPVPTAMAMTSSDPVGGSPSGPPVGPTPVPTAMAMMASEPVGGTPDGPPVGPTPVPTAMAAKISPAAQRTADTAGIDASAVQGTGRGGVISKPDVVTAIAAGVKPPAPPAPAPAPAVVRTGDRETREKMTTRRKRIAENLLQAQHNTAHLTTFNEIDMSATTALRARLKDKVEKEHGVKLSFMPFFVKAATHALKAFPLVNAQLDGDSIVYKHYVNMGIAVASDAGLVVPNVKDADQKGMLDISRDIANLANKARTGKLAMDDLTGGTFTITNGGVFGSLLSTPIINYPQVAILGLHKTQDRPVAIDGKVEIRPMMYVALSYDHRIIDGQQAVLFLVRIKELMEDPAAMLVS